MRGRTYTRVKIKIISHLVDAVSSIAYATRSATAPPARSQKKKCRVQFMMQSLPKKNVLVFETTRGSIYMVYISYSTYVLVYYCKCNIINKSCGRRQNEVAATTYFRVYVIDKDSISFTRPDKTRTRIIVRAIGGIHAAWEDQFRRNARSHT